MLTVPEAADRANRTAETIRRWIRTGKLKARKIGTQHVIEEADLDELLASDTLPVPEGWGRTKTGGPMPDVVGAVRSSRASH